MYHFRSWLANGLLLMAFGLLASTSALADSGSDTNPLKGITFEGVGYVDYSAGDTDVDTAGHYGKYNRFKVTRGYFTFKKKVTSWMSVRVTMDIHQDETGDYKRRDKYFYAEFRPKDQGPFTEMISEVGIGHMPWLDFEEHINPYRCQGTMAVERAGTFNSADVGVSLRGNFGDPMEDAAGKTGNNKYAGRFGSWHVGVYNGGGYHASEKNESKVLEGRVTLRPLADVAPGLQLSYLGLLGKGNVENEGALPDYNVHLGMVSYEHPDVAATAQVFMTEGNAKGKWVGPDGKALETFGYSAFANVKVPGTERKLNIFGRYDFFDSDADNVFADASNPETKNTAYRMFILGGAVSVHKSNLVLIAIESTDFEANFGTNKGAIPGDGTPVASDTKVQVVYQIKI